MKLRNIFEEQSSLPGIQNAKIQMTYLPKDKWDWTDHAKDVYNQGGLNALFDFLAKKFKQSAEEIKQDYEGDRAQFTSEIEAVEEYLDIMNKIPLNAEAGGGGAGGGAGAGAGGGASAGAGAGGGASAGAGASSGGDGGSASSSGDSGSAGSGDTGSADSTPSDAPSMDAPVSRGYAFLGSMMPGKKKKKKKKKKTKGFDFGKGVY